MKWYALIKWLTYAGMSVANLNSGGSLWPQSNIYFPIPGKISDKFGVAQFGRNGGSLCSGICSGSIEGLYINGQIQFGLNDTSQAYVSNFSISRCYINGGIYFNNVSGPNSSSNILISECVILGSTSNSVYGGPTGFVSISNCLIGGLINSLSQSLLQNNIFLFSQQFYNGLAFSGTSCVVKNNIFYTNHYMSGTNNLFYNNIGIWNNGVYTGSYATNAFGSGNIVEPWDSTFVKTNTTILYNNYHLKNNSIGKNVGTDGKDIGIYGGIHTWQEGGIPSNPHIYFKQVDDNSSTDGKLKVKYKVRTN